MSVFVETDDFRSRLMPGQYVARTAAVVFLSQGTGDSRRDIEFTSYKVGDRFEVTETTNGFWYGLEPNGTMFSPQLASVEMVDS